MHDDDTAWKLVKPYRGTTSARIRFLSPADQQRLLDAAEGDLRDLVAAALMTGARFGELSRLQLQDFDVTNGSVFIAESKSGKARHVPLTPAAGCSSSGSQRIRKVRPPYSAVTASPGKPRPTIAR